MPQVPGRLEVLRDAPTVLRDYAHTPDALERALDAVRPFTPRAADRRLRLRRRSRSGQAARDGRASPNAKADLAIVTSDNPRTEDPERILDDIETGMTATKHERIEDRRAAIARALEIAAPRRRGRARRQGPRDVSDSRDDEMPVRREDHRLRALASALARRESR